MGERAERMHPPWFPCPKGIPSRGAYYGHYTGKKWGDCHNYHLSLDSGALGFDLCVKLITQAAQEM